MNYTPNLAKPLSHDTRTHYPGRGIVSYAQNREDVLLWRALHRIESGFYVDIGAHDPDRFSVTRAFYDHGWSGLNVEPDPFYAGKLRRDRSRDVTLQVALGRAEGRATLFDFGEHGLSTLRPDIAADALASGLEAARHEVSVRTLADVLAEHAPGEIHFLKIDVEGAEAEVLAGADFRRFRPWILVIEALRPVTLAPSHDAWEQHVLDQDYAFACFDGLNRYYVAREHGDLATALSVPVNINDPFEDAGRIALEQRVARLLERDATSVAPRLGLAAEVPLAAAPDDAAGLLDLVEIQARELGRLRRALVAARALGEQRLALLRGWPAPEPDAADGPLPGAALGVLQAGLREAQSDIADILERSRWRRLGLRLGLARRAPWETTAWQADPGLLAPALAGTADQARRLRGEYARLTQYRADLGRSRWRRLGQRLGLARRLPWEDAAMAAPPPTALPVQARAAEARTTQAPVPETSAGGYEAMVEYTTRRFLEECRRAAVDVVLDVGANAGQFAAGLRATGHAGQIVSFEPLSAAHAALSAQAAQDALWSVAPRCAVGARTGEAQIYVAGNSYSSSLLPMLEAHRSAAPESAYVDTEACPVVTLDAVIEHGFTDPTTRFSLKMDTQGFEAEVLRGLERHSDRVAVILCEMSLTPLYEGAPDLFGLCRMLAERGYRCVALGPEFEDPRSGVLLQVNGVFARPAG